MIHPKVSASAGGSAFGASVAIVLLWLLSLYHVQIPTDVAQAITGIFSTLSGLALGYITPMKETPSP